MTDDRAERLARQIRSACGQYNNDDQPVVLCVAQMEAKLAIQSNIPVWLDPYTNNGDRRYDTEYRQGWNACRDAMLATVGDSHE